MKHTLFFTCLSFLFSLGANAQTFTNSSSLLTTTFASGGATGVTDLNNDGLDDLVILHMSKELYAGYQQADGTFEFYYLTTAATGNQWGMCVGDVDNDGHKDVMCGGYYDGIKLIRIADPLNIQLSVPQNVEVYMQACNFADINNDGWLDGFACHDDGASHRFRNDGTGDFINGNDFFNYMVYPQSDMSGNYGSEWSDFDRDGDLDLMVAKCRQFVNNPLDPRRTNLLFVNDGNNNYTDEAHDRGLVNLQQSWTSNFADIDNDGDFDCFITTHSGTIELYENTGGGYFTNITAQSGVGVSGFFLQSKAMDFDNDGWIDFIYGGGTSGILRNNGDKTFTLIPQPFPGSQALHSFAIGDLNHDGWPDVFCNYGTSYVTPNPAEPDRLYLNDGGVNHWIAFDLEGTISNRDAVGALVEIHGPWGIQIREVRAGESYGITNTFHMMFGIGSETTVDYAVIHWPAGGLQVIENPQIDTYHEIIELNCAIAQPEIALNGPSVLCEGDFAVLELLSSTGPILWSNGGSGATSTAESPGYYSAYLFDVQTTCAAQSNVITISPAPSPEVQISLTADPEICEGTFIEITSSAGEGTNWSTGQNGGAILVGDAGVYSASIDALCGPVYSNELEVTVLPAPAPDLADVLVDYGASAELTLDGDSINWYDSEFAEEPLFTGNTFVTPPITGAVSYWVEEVHQYGGDSAQGGKAEKEESPYGQFHNSTSFWNRFDAHQDMILNSVKVFAGNTSNRTIQLVGAGNNVLQSLTAEVPQGESFVALNFFVPEGTGYGLRLSGSNPQLWRDRNIDLPAPFAFPYTIGEIATITGTTVTGNDTDNYYYFFYDWSVQTPLVECLSPRTEVQIAPVGIEERGSMLRSFAAYPNPARDNFTLEFNSLQPGTLQMRITDAGGRSVRQSSIVAVQGRNVIKLDCSAYGPGVYEIQLSRDGDVLNQRVVIH